MLFRAIVILSVMTSSATAGVWVYEAGPATFPQLTAGWGFEIVAQPYGGDKIVGFDFGSDPRFGFFAIQAQFNQINPLGLPTIFSNNNYLFSQVGQDPINDTQFLFDGSGYVHYVLPENASYSSESDFTLRAVFSLVSFSPPPPIVSIAHVVLKGCAFRYQGNVIVETPSHTYEAYPINGYWACPEPCMLSLLVIALSMGALARLRR